MLARLQQAITLTFLALLMGVTAYWLGRGRVDVAVMAVLLLLTVHPAVLAAEFVMLAWVHRGDPAPRPGAWGLVNAWWREVRTATVVFGWQQPWRHRAEPDHLPDDGAAQGRTGVVLVHGFFCNRGFWNPWMRRLRAAGVPFCAVTLEPVFGSIDHYPRLVDEAVAAVERATGRPVVVVAHSMGGLAVRAWLKAGGASERVQRVVTVATPHQGTLLARFAFVANARQMRLRSEWLRALRLSEHLHPGNRERFTSYYGNCDNIVMPPHAACLPGADNRLLTGTAHVCLAFRPEVFDEVLRLVSH